MAQGAPEVGSLFADRYRVERVLGQGGMGVVFAARHPILDQTVAIKLLLPHVSADEGHRERFLNEAKAGALLENEHIARVLDVATLSDGQPYIVMEHLDGSDLASVLRQRKQIPFAEVADHILQACEGIASAHLHGIVHRDLKPSNLFLTRRRDRARLLKVLDFGISKIADSDVTATDALLGSPAYMSPEQTRSTKLVDARTDIWSLGVVMYELVTGKRPFTGDNVGQIVVSVLEHRPPPISAVVPSVPQEFSAVVDRCLSKDPLARYASVAALAEALAPFTSASSFSSLQRISDMKRTLEPDQLAAFQRAALQAEPSAVRTPQTPLGTATATIVDPAPILAPIPAAVRTGSAWVGQRPGSSTSGVLAVLGAAALLLASGGLVFAGRYAASKRSSSPLLAPPAVESNVDASGAAEPAMPLPTSSAATAEAAGSSAPSPLPGDPATSASATTPPPTTPPPSMATAKRGRPPPAPGQKAGGLSRTRD